MVYKLPDQARITLGDANDLKIYHSGTHSIIQDTGTGNLEIKGSTVKIRGTAGGDNALIYTEDAGVELYYDNSKKLETVTGGVTVTGTATADGFTTTGTWTFDEFTSGTIGITTVQDSGTGFDDNDTSLMTAAAVADKIEDYGYTTEVGDIIGVTAGTGMSGGGTSGTVTLTNAGVTSNVAGSGIGVSGATGAVTITNSVLLQQ